MKVSIIVPVLYGESQLATTLEDLAELSPALDLEILVVVDVPDPARAPQARADNDPVASSAGASVHYRIGERGFGSALRSGFARTVGDVMIPVMADRSDEFEAIPRMVQAVERGCDVVAGSRYMRGGAVIGNTPKQRLSRLFSALFRGVGGPPISDITNSFKAYRREVVSSVDTIANSFDLSAELTLKAARAGYRICEVPAIWTNRTVGRSNWHLRRELWNYGRWLLLAAFGRRASARRATVG